MSDIVERLRELFPSIEFGEDWLKCNYPDGYVSGYPNDLRLDGDFTPEQLQALVDWCKARAALGGKP